MKLACVNKDQSESPVAEAASVVPATGTVCKSTSWSFPPDPASDAAALSLEKRPRAGKTVAQRARLASQDFVVSR
jgi:hypothetical protein